MVYSFIVAAPSSYCSFFACPFSLMSCLFCELLVFEILSLHVTYVDTRMRHGSLIPGMAGLFIMSLRF